LEPVQFLSASEVQRMVTTESKMFSIYAEGQVKGYRREARVRAHAVVDFRPGAQGAMATPTDGSAAAGTGGAAGSPGLSAGVAGSGGSAGSGVAIPTGPTAGPEGAGTVVYYRNE
ncbi:MAG TPA: hypothetical protein VFS00_31090, partial [Polyangiaceae bacterium]|nr:hypothetical protein [Polyangiaceae bacterium]